MITKLCMSTGWDFDKVMGMKMLTFAMFYRHSQKIEEDKFNRLLFEMCDVVGVAYGGPGYQGELKQHYLAKLLPEKQLRKLQSPRVFDLSDKQQADNAVSVLVSALKMKKKLMGI